MKVVITARNFNIDPSAKALLVQNGFTVQDESDRVFATQEAYFEAIDGADAVINAIEPMGADLLQKCEKLKLIAVRGVGYDYIDSAVCRTKGIAIARTVGAVEAAVAEQAVAYILHFARRIDEQNASMQRGEWHRMMQTGADGMTLGILGFGGIGKAIAVRATALGMTVRYYCRHPQDACGATYAPLDKLLQCSDYLVLALPLTEETRGMIGKHELAQMKNGAVLINVARAAIVDTNALCDALKSGEIGGAAVDVFETEPCADSPLLGLPNCILTPHTAPFTKNNFIRMNRLAAENVINFFGGTIDAKYLVR